ncbi:MAG: hypothetical protein O7B99_05160 [Planctomycetota bacterium]|nr:hypothetical protein [Planctomycetota bacterium]
MSLRAPILLALAFANVAPLTAATSEPAPSQDRGSAAQPKQGQKPRQGPQEKPGEAEGEVVLPVPPAEGKEDPFVVVETLDFDPLGREERDSMREAFHLRNEEVYFLTCDHDSNGWISYREAHTSMAANREEFAQFDGDHDGRITRAEFGRRYSRVIQGVGIFKPPVPPVTGAPHPSEGPLTYDFNRSGRLELSEVARYLEDESIAATAAEAMKLLDADGSGTLEVNELAAITIVLEPLEPRDPPEPSEPEPPKTIEELFGGSTPRKEQLGANPLPDRIVGPVPQFRRLDLDNDGGIELEDLRKLLTPAQVNVNAVAVIAVLDMDRDGVLSRVEFLAAIGAAP